MLVEHAPEVVGKRELIARAWGNLVVDDGSLRVHVAALRKTLGDGESGLVTLLTFRVAVTALQLRLPGPPHWQPLLKLHHRKYLRRACRGACRGW
jgi:hypothetical protein